MGDVAKIDATPLLVYFRIVTEYSGDDLIYLGMNRRPDAVGTDDDWEIVKIEWSSSVFQSSQKYVDVIWDDRATYNWSF